MDEISGLEPIPILGHFYSGFTSWLCIISIAASAKPNTRFSDSAFPLGFDIEFVTCTTHLPLRISKGLVLSFDIRLFTHSAVIIQHVAQKIKTSFDTSFFVSSFLLLLLLRDAAIASSPLILTASLSHTMRDVSIRPNGSGLIVTLSIE